MMACQIAAPRTSERFCSSREGETIHVFQEIKFIASSHFTVPDVYSWWQKGAVQQYCPTSPLGWIRRSGVRHFPHRSNASFVFQAHSLASELYWIWSRMIRATLDLELH